MNVYDDHDGSELLLLIFPISEAELSKHHLVASAVMFGHNRSIVGVIIEPEHVRSNSQTDLGEDDFLDAIWSVANIDSIAARLTLVAGPPSLT